MTLSLDDFIVEESKMSSVEIKAKIGSIFLTDFDDKDQGFVLKEGETSRQKFFIVIGNDSSGNAIGVIFINTKPNPKVNFNKDFLDTQYFILQRDYSKFLKYDSYVDCSKIRELCNDRIHRFKFKGNILPDDLERIMDMLKTSETIRVKEKKRFGLI